MWGSSARWRRMQRDCRLRENDKFLCENPIEIVFKMMSVGATQRNIVATVFLCFCGTLGETGVFFGYSIGSQKRITIRWESLKIQIKLLVKNKKLIEHFQVSVEIVVWVNTFSGWYFFRNRIFQKRPNCWRIMSKFSFWFFYFSSRTFFRFRRVNEFFYFVNKYWPTFLIFCIPLSCPFALVGEEVRRHWQNSKFLHRLEIVFWKKNRSIFYRLMWVGESAHFMIIERRHMSSCNYRIWDKTRRRTTYKKLQLKL